MVEPLVGPDLTRRLLADGLVLSLDRHRLRYVSGRAAEGRLPVPEADAPDLLGPEFDLPRGRIAALAEGRPPAPAEDPEAGAGAGRS
jgi:hypothetical protein